MPGDLDAVLQRRKQKALAPKRYEQFTELRPGMGELYGYHGLHEQQLTQLQSAVDAVRAQPGSADERLVLLARRFLQDARAWLTLPRKRGSIGALEAAIDGLERLALQAKSMPGQDLSAEGGKLAKMLANRLEFCALKRKFYQEVRRLQQPQTAASIRNMLETHTFSEGGKHFVNLYRHKHAERFDPNHGRSAGKSLLEDWTAFMNAKLVEKQDPYASLDEFLLERCDERRMGFVRPYFSATERDYYRLLYGWEINRPHHALLHALYKTAYGSRGYRYMHNLDGHDPYGALACRFMAHTSRHYSTEISRETDDMVDGELYAMDGKYRFYTFPRSEVHSVLLAGEAVMCAGIIVVEEGKVLAIDNKSGHYQPKWPHLHQAVCELEFHDVMAPDAIVVLETGGQNMLFHKDDFVALGNQRFPYAATREVLAGYYKRFGSGIPGPRHIVERLGWKAADQWSGGSAKAYLRFLRQLFPNNMKRWQAAGDMFFNGAQVPDLRTWKRDTDLGPLATRGERLVAVDKAIERVNQVLRTQQWPHPFPDVDAIEGVLMALLGAVRAWLQEKAGKRDSRRRVAVEKLHAEIEEDLGFLKQLRHSEPELMPERSPEGV